MSGETISTEQIEAVKPAESETEVIARLKNEGLQIIPPPEFELPERYNFRALESIGVPANELEKTIDFFLRYLRSPVVNDSNYEIGQDEELIRRRKELIALAGRVAENLLLRPKLGHNSVSSITSKFEFWQSKSERLQNWSLAAQMKKWNSSFPAKIYRGWANEPSHLQNPSSYLVSWLPN